MRHSILTNALWLSSTPGEVLQASSCCRTKNVVIFAALEREFAPNLRVKTHKSSWSIVRHAVQDLNTCQPQYKLIHWRETWNTYLKMSILFTHYASTNFPCCPLLHNAGCTVFFPLICWVNKNCLQLNPKKTDYSLIFVILIKLLLCSFYLLYYLLCFSVSVFMLCLVKHYELPCV